MAAKFDVFVVGDSTVDLFLNISEDSAYVLCQKEHCQLCFNYAEKIPLKEVARFVATGNAANFAVAAAKLGLKVGLYTLLGDDQDGKASKALLKQAGVNTKYALTDPGKSSNVSAVLNYQGERTILSFHQTRQYDLPNNIKTNWFYFSSVAEVTNHLEQQLVALVKASGAKLVFNPGSLQLKRGLIGMRDLLAICQLLILNKEEACALLDQTKETPVTEMLAQLQTFGPKIVVITDGQQGSWCADGTSKYFMPIVSSPVKDRTGAGDSYAAGLIAALVLGKSLRLKMILLTMQKS